MHVPHKEVTLPILCSKRQGILLKFLSLCLSLPLSLFLSLFLYLKPEDRELGTKFPSCHKLTCPHSTSFALPVCPNGKLKFPSWYTFVPGLRTHPALEWLPYKQRSVWILQWAVLLSKWTFLPVLWPTDWLIKLPSDTTGTVNLKIYNSVSIHKFLRFYMSAKFLISHRTQRLLFIIIYCHGQHNECLNMQ